MRRVSILTTTVAARTAVTLASLAVAGCGARATAQAPARIEVACSATGPAATCVFTNTGATPGGRCVTVLAGRRGSPTIVRSPAACAEKLAPGTEAQREVTFGSPLDCAPPAECLARPADAGHEDAVQAALGDELAAPPTGPVTQAECTAVANHLFDLSFAEATSLRTPEERAAIERDVAAERGRQIDQYRDTCLRRVTRAQLACAMAATDAAELRRCDEVR